jgi:hypothetical protein
MLVIGFLLATDGARTSDRVGGVALLTVLPFMGWLFYWRPYVELSARLLYVRNPIRSHLVKLEAVTETSPLSTGLGIELEDGTQLVAWALQQGLLMSLLCSGSRAATAGRTILEAARTAREA